MKILVFCNFSATLLVLSLVRDYGFNDAQICKLVRYCPKLLVSDVEKYLLPKFQFFLSLGASKAELRNVFSSNPSILRASLKNKIIPYYHILRDVVCLDDRSIVRCDGLKCPTSVIKTTDVENISLLRSLGVPQSSVSLLASCNPSVLVHRAENFCAFVKRTVELGFNPSTVKFIKALVAFGCLRPSKWVRKFETLGKLGWSEDEIWSAFKKQPILMTLSEKKVRSVMQFLVNEMGMLPSTIAKAPNILFYSLKKRVMPRDVNFATVVGYEEKCFMVSYVNRYQSLVPNLGKIYAAEMDKL
ncbi:hypothetical protein K2173_025471 [Erythroxylum novogranatense]|uniref:Uncharacterized protein n=1 Tax=Erythroxylum novogranatense TaxID=1862640 RepID=A0AAV8SB44_9ROSI|nr:hypothetical protein K2173_025471 [Erythroxylum novogranatense]